MLEDGLLLLFRHRQEPKDSVSQPLQSSFQSNKCLASVLCPPRLRLRGKAAAPTHAASSSICRASAFPVACGSSALHILQLSVRHYYVPGQNDVFIAWHWVGSGRWSPKFIDEGWQEMKRHPRDVQYARCLRSDVYPEFHYAAKLAALLSQTFAIELHRTCSIGLARPRYKSGYSKQ